MKKIKKLLSVFLVGILSLGVFALVGCKKTEDTVLNEDSLIVTPSVKNGIEIVTLSSETVQTENEVYIQKTLQATITNVDGTTSTECVWSVAWGDNALNEDVANYIKVSPQTNASIVNVRCYKPFTGSTIIITASTSSSSASCVCEYVGVPDRILGEFNGVNYILDQTFVVEKGTYTFNLSLSNAFGVVDSTNPNYSVNSISGTGKFVVTQSEYVGDGVTETHEYNIEMADICSDFVSVSLDGNVLTVNVLQTVNNYYNHNYSGNISFKDFYYDPRGGGVPNECTVNIYITEAVTGLNYSINIKPISNINLDSYSLVF